MRDGWGRGWSEDETKTLMELGPLEYLAQYGEGTGRSYDSVVSRYNRLRRAGVPTQREPSSRTEPMVTERVGVMAGERPSPEEIRERHSIAFNRLRETEARKRNQVLSFSDGPVMFALVSDVHIGSPQCDLDRAYEEQELINATPGAHTFLLGDIVDNFIVGKLRDQNMQHSLTIPDEWVLFDDYVNRWENLEAFVMGNHDKWSISQAGADLHRRLINMGSVFYDSDDLRLRVNVGDASVLFRLRHKLPGSSQYSKTFAQIKSIMFDDPEPDIVVSGHTHTGALTQEITHAGKRKLAVQLGTYKVADPYAIQEGFPENDNSTVVSVIIWPDGSFFGTHCLSAACQFMERVYG